MCNAPDPRNPDDNPLKVEESPLIFAIVILLQTWF